MTIKKQIAGFGAAGMALCVTTMPALAHHVMGGKMPSTLAQGFVSGIGHPIVGMDHFLFIVGVGLLAAFTGRRLLLPIAFVLGTLGGTAVHLAGASVPFTEPAILLSVALMAVAVIANARLPGMLIAGLVAFAGLFHGYAYAESIFGAEPTPLYAYLMGFAAIQFVIAFAAASIFDLLQKREAPLAHTYARVAGGAMLGVAMVAVSNMAFSL